MSQHTPGPWHQIGFWVEHEDDDVADICLCDPADLGQGHLKRSDDEIIANARLIAAAPEMLEALRMLQKAMSERNYFAIENAFILDQGYAYKALAKAEGQR